MVAHHEYTSLKCLLTEENGRIAGITDVSGYLGKSGTHYYNPEFRETVPSLQQSGPSEVFRWQLGSKYPKRFDMEPDDVENFVEADRAKLTKMFMKLENGVPDPEKKQDHFDHRSSPTV